MKNIEKYWQRKFDDLAVSCSSDWQRSWWWDHDTLRHHQRFILNSLKGFARGKPLQVADIGCGSGSHSISLVEHGHVAIGVDFAENALRVAQKRDSGKKIMLCLGDAKELPLKKESQEAVLSIGLLQTAKEPWQHLEQLDFILKRGGLLLLSTLSRQGKWELPWWPVYCLMYCDGFPSRTDFIQSLVGNRRQMSPRPIDGIHDPAMVFTRFSAAELKARLKKMGYHRIKIENNSRFTKLPLLYNSFMINISAVKRL